MIITFETDAPRTAIETVVKLAQRFPGVTARRHDFCGSAATISEVQLMGPTHLVPVEAFESMPGVRHAVRASGKHRLIGRHEPGLETRGFTYNGVTFDEHDVLVCAGVCAAETPEDVEETMAAVRDAGLVTTCLGAYDRRSSPHASRRFTKEWLPWVFELAGRYGIRVIVMQVTDARQLEEINGALEHAGDPTGVMLEIGTPDIRNVELLRQVGQQRNFPVLLQRGPGVALEESLDACESIAREGNQKIVFCLRGVRPRLGEPHRDLVDFAHVPVVRRETRLPVCVDPSHGVGRSDASPEGLPDAFHAVGQGLIAGASMVLVDVHPRPESARGEGSRALGLTQLPSLLRYVTTVRGAFEEVAARASVPPPPSRRAQGVMAPLSSASPDSVDPLRTKPTRADIPAVRRARLELCVEGLDEPEPSR